MTGCNGSGATITGQREPGATTTSQPGPFGPPGQAKLEHAIHSTQATNPILPIAPAFVLMIDPTSEETLKTETLRRPPRVSA